MCLSKAFPPETLQHLIVTQGTFKLLLYYIFYIIHYFVHCNIVQQHWLIWQREVIKLSAHPPGMFYYKVFTTLQRKNKQIICSGMFYYKVFYYMFYYMLYYKVFTTNYLLTLEGAVRIILVDNLWEYHDVFANLS